MPALLAAAASISQIAQPATHEPSPKTSPPAPTILYEEAIDESGLRDLVRARATKCLVVYQHLADESSRSGSIDTASLLRYVGERMGSSGAEWGILDFEEPYDQWLSEGPSSERWAAASKSMVHAIKEVRRLYPKTKWTYYGIPSLPYYLKHNGEMLTWDRAPAAPKAEEMARQLAAHSAIMSECDWLAPCAYITVGVGNRSTPEPVRTATRAYIEARVQLCAEFCRGSNRSVPILPFVSPMYQIGGGARSFSCIPAIELAEDCIRPAKVGGAVGFCIWTAGPYFVNQATATGTDVAFADCGGREAVMNRWSEDLGIPIEALRGPEGKDRLMRMFSEAQVRLANLIRAEWQSPNLLSAPK